MYQVRFYKDAKGNSPVLDVLEKLSAQRDKESRIRLNKIKNYIDVLENFGTTIGEPYIKHIEGKIYELRPMKDRIMFAAYTGKEFILLSHFIKKTQKSPAREIEKAQKRFNDFLERE